MKFAPGKPRMYCNAPEAFGKSRYLVFAAVPLLSEDVAVPESVRRSFSILATRARAAARQHEVALDIRLILHANKTDERSLATDQRSFAKMYGLNERRLGAILNGYLAMRPADLEHAKMALPSLEGMLRRSDRRSEHLHATALLQYERGIEDPGLWHASMSDLERVTLGFPLSDGFPGASEISGLR
ncbi:hypothetical protein OH146_12195 [Salinibacterium sp. SYSU T00001]|uniref:hypothetical protein n=1 Tax=Homoserinimonas sedimenticola TaxID=2986805 RepID=UPI0022367705|nr:hypothetical protein [Salinibacterium sedimenticola]MCW4386534.1 hypothetical protein [Salinibacterium sedimenticola]